MADGFIVFGGIQLTTGAPVLKDGLRYRKSTGWSMMAPAPDSVLSPRIMTMHWCSDARCWFWSGVPLTTADKPDLLPPIGGGAEYEFSTSTWTARPTAGEPIPRVGYAAVWTGSYGIFWGGHGSDSTVVSDGAVYAP